MTAIRRLAWTIAALAFALIVLGALVRATNSGLSCPDWPTCYGQWVLTPSEFAQLPDTGYTYGQVMLEWVHRLIAGVFVGPLVLVLLVLLFLRRREHPDLLAAGAVLVALLVVQKLLGGITVLDRNSPWSVALHLGNAMFVLAALLWIAVRASPAARTEAPSGLRMLAAGCWVLVFATVTSAAIVAKSGASLACSTWPSCDGALLPDLADPLIRANFTHRLLAALSALALSILALRAMRAAMAPGTARLAEAAAILVWLEVGLGALTVWSEIATELAVLHQALGVAVFASVTLFWWRLREAARPEAQRAADGLALRGA